MSHSLLLPLQILEFPKPPARDHSPPVSMKPLQPNLPLKQPRGQDTDYKLDIRIFPLEQEKPQEKRRKCKRSVEVQTEEVPKTSIRLRNVSTQHAGSSLKLPRSFGTLTVRPWSGDGGSSCSDFCPRVAKETRETNRKNSKGIYTLPLGQP